MAELDDLRPGTLVRVLDAHTLTPSQRTVINRCFRVERVDPANDLCLAHVLLVLGEAQRTCGCHVFYLHELELAGAAALIAEYRRG